MLVEKLCARRTKLSLIGLGYVGLPIAIAFSKLLNVIGFDLNSNKIQRYKNGIDVTCEVGDAAVKNCSVEFTDEPAKLEEARFHIIAVPTPVKDDSTPDFSPIISASHILGQHLQKGSIVVYESTVYPGATEEICIPILEEESGLHCGADFKVGYSPERINPGDMVHRLENIRKIVSGIDEEALQEIRQVYDLVITAGTVPVSSIKIAEAIKVVENTQRDVNIAFMNELAIMFDHMGIDTNEVVDGMNTKWNALGFRPGLVGGHCIGVDPYYLTYQSERCGFQSQLIPTGRKINEGMGAYIAEAAIRQMVLSDMSPISMNVVIMGLTFKENCNDLRNSKVKDIYDHLLTYGIHPVVCDPLADSDECQRMYNIKLVPLSEIKDAQCIILAVAHDQFRQMGFAGIRKLFMKDILCHVLIDVKGILDRNEVAQDPSVNYWRL